MMVAIDLISVGAGGICQVYCALVVLDSKLRPKDITEPGHKFLDTQSQDDLFHHS